MKIPTQSTVSQFIPSKLPEFVVENYPTFVAFTKAYYEWVETHGKVLFTGRALDATYDSLVLPGTASNKLNYYAGYSVAINNGPAAGQFRVIDSYDPVTKTIHITPTWDVVPVHYSSFSIVDDNSPSKILEYADIDTTVDDFVRYFKNEFLRQIPGNILADQRLVLKHIREFYKARGTEKSYKFLMRILFNEDVEFYYPKVDILKTSDGKWFVEKIIRITSSSNTFDWLHRQLQGEISGTTAFVESVKHIQFGDLTVSELELSHVSGDFHLPDLPEPLEQVYIQEPTPPASNSLENPTTTYRVDRLQRVVTDIEILDSGDGYRIGDPITVTGPESYPAQAVVSAIYVVDFLGYAQDPPASQLLEPYFEQRPADEGEDQASIPGTLWGGFFWSDVFMDYGGYVIGADQIILQVDADTRDDFYVGDDINLVQGPGAGQHRIIIAYDGFTKIATLNQPWVVWPNSLTKYIISHNRGKIKKVQVTEFGVGFNSEPTVNFVSSTGQSAVGRAILGAIGVYPGRWLNDDGFTNSTKRIQDSYYYQDFSYVLRLGQSLDQYRDAVKALLHPAGTKLFGEVLVQTHSREGVLDAVQALIIYLDAKTYSFDIQASTVLQRSFEVEAGPVGIANIDIDRFKLTAFMPTPGVSLRYPFPNQHYWDSIANTQITHLASMNIGDFFANPDQSPPFGFETFMQIRGDRAVSLAEPSLGPTWRTLDRTKFEDSVEDIASPFFGNISETSIAVFGDMPITEAINGGSTSFVPDALITILGSSLVPAAGNVAQFDFRIGQDPQTLYNINPSAYEVVNGRLSMAAQGGAIPVWTNLGMSFRQSAIDLTQLDVSTSGQTVIVVTRSRRLPVSLATIISSTFQDSENGYSVETGNGGTINFRVNSGDQTMVVSSAKGVIRQNGWFAAALRFDVGTLNGWVNQSNVGSAGLISFAAPPNNSDGWWLGKAAVAYSGLTSQSSLVNHNRFGQTRFGQTATTGSARTTVPFDGDLAYALIYDRAISDHELDSVYKFLQIELEKRGINLP